MYAKSRARSNQTRVDLLAPQAPLLVATMHDADSSSSSRSERSRTLPLLIGGALLVIAGCSAIGVFFGSVLDSKQKLQHQNREAIKELKRLKSHSAMAHRAAARAEALRLETAQEIERRERKRLHALNATFQQTMAHKLESAQTTIKHRLESAVLLERREKLQHAHRLDLAQNTTRNLERALQRAEREAKQRARMAQRLEEQLEHSNASAQETLIRVRLELREARREIEREARRRAKAEERADAHRKRLASLRERLHELTALATPVDETGDATPSTTPPAVSTPMPVKARAAKVESSSRGATTATAATTTAWRWGRPSIVITEKRNVSRQAPWLTPTEQAEMIKVMSCEERARKPHRKQCLGRKHAAARTLH